MKHFFFFLFLLTLSSITACSSEQEDILRERCSRSFDVLSGKLAALSSGSCYKLAAFGCQVKALANHCTNYRGAYALQALTHARSKAGSCLHNNSFPKKWRRVILCPLIEGLHFYQTNGEFRLKKRERHRSLVDLRRHRQYCQTL